MRRIVIDENDGMLILRTFEYDGYIYLRLEDGKAITSLLDDNTCQKTFGCSAGELKKYIKDYGY